MTTFKKKLSENLSERSMYYVDGRSLLLKVQPLNRDLDLNHIARITSAMIDGAIVPPIELSKESCIVIDGHHRYYAAIEVWKTNPDYRLDFYFSDISVYDEIMTKIHRNNNTKSWILSDYLKKFAGSGNVNYRNLVGFLNNPKHSLLRDKNGIFQITAAMDLLGKSNDDLKKGDLIVTTEDLIRGEHLYSKLLLFVNKFTELNNYVAAHQITKRSNIKTWSKAYPLLLNHFGNDNEILNQLHRFVNPIDTNKRVLWKASFENLMK